MKRWEKCLENASQENTYYCHVMQSDRLSEEERICDICESFQEACRKDTKLQDTFSFVAEAHKGQVRKGTTIPYLIHLLRTWNYVRLMTGDLEEQEAALLHDVLEDTKVSALQLRERFGEKVFDLVAGESEYKREERPPGETWKLRKMETIERLRNRIGKSEEHSAMHIAFGDKLANLYSMWFEYRVIGDALWNKFNQKDKAMHAWYYGEMGKIFATYFAEDMEMELVEEYKNYYREVFHDEI